MKFFRFIYSASYFGILGYVVFFARRRRDHHYNYEVNLIPIKNTLETFFSTRMNDKFEAFNFYVNLFGNIVLFIPFSIILLRVFKIRKLKFILLWATLLSIFIEVMQYLFQVGLPDIDDIILNISGAVFGFYLYKLVLQMNFFPSLRQASQ